MKLQIQSIHFTINNDLNNLIKRKIFKIFNIDKNILNTEIFLKLDKPSSYNNKIFEIKIQSSKSSYFAKKKSNTFEESLDLALHALRKQIVKNKQIQR